MAQVLELRQEMIFGVLDTFLRYCKYINLLDLFYICFKVIIVFIFFSFIGLSQRITEQAGVVLTLDPKPIEVLVACNFSWKHKRT